MPGYIVGDSFGDVQRSDLQSEGMQRAAFAQSMANLLGSLRERNNRNLAIRQQDLEQGYHAAQMEHAKRELELKNQEAIWRNQRDLEHNKISQGYLDMQKNMLDWQKSQPTASTIRQQDYENALANNQANQGYFDSPDHVRSVYPWMSEPQANLLADQSGRARSQMDYDYKTASDAANTLNRQSELLKTIDATTKASKAVPWYRSTPPEVKQAVENLPKLKEELADVTSRAGKIQADKRLSGLVSYNPQTGRYESTIAQPQWSQGGGRTAPSYAPAPSRVAVTPEDETANPGSSTGSTGGLRFASPEDQAGGVGGGAQAAPASTATGTTGRKYSPMVYDRVNYWVGQGMQPPDALSRALGEQQALFGSQ